MTADGFKKLKKELDDLVTVLRKDIAEEIHKAMEFGDLSENAAYSTAIEKRDLNESRIVEIEDMIERAEVVTASSSKSHRGTVQLGNTVTIKANGAKVVWTIVGAFEGNPAERKVSIETPIGSALMNKKIGDKVKVDLPTGPVIYEIVSIN